MIRRREIGRFTVAILLVILSQSTDATVYPDFAGEWSGTVTITKLTGLDVEPSQQQVHECPLRLWVHADGTATAELDMSESASGLASGTVALAEDALSNSVASLSLCGNSALSTAMSGFLGDNTVAHTLTLELDTADPDRMTGTYDQLCTECPGSLSATGNADLRRLTNWTDSAVPTAGSRIHTTGHGYTTETLHKSSDFNSSIIRGLIADTDAWEPNGDVFAVACGANTVYLGGFFSYIGPRTGAGVPLDINTGLPESPYPMVERAEGELNEVFISTCVSDGNGGWFIGGMFKSVGGALRDNLAHILPNGTVDPDWNPGVNDSEGARVGALFLCGNILYVGGAFNVVGGRWRENIAALDAYTGSVTDWDPVANEGIDSLVASATRVYVAGGFSSIGGQDRNYLAALDATTGAAVTGWNPNPNHYVYALALDGDRLYVGGKFYMIGGQTRNAIAALDAATGSVIADWNPNSNHYVYALAVDGSVVYAGGRFFSIGGQPRNNIAALDTATGAAITTWAPNPNGYVYVLAASNTMVYAGGDFTSIDGQVRHHIAALDKSSGAVTAWNPMAGNTVETLAIHGETIYAGGVFTSVGGEERNNVAALDASTGALTTWNPDANDIVETLLLTDTAVYAGGGFTEIGGKTRNYLAKLDTTVGFAVPEWAPEADDYVFALDVSSTSVYAGGYFTSINGQPRNHLAALDKSTGSLSSWNPDVNECVRSLDVTADTVYFGGDFTRVGGQTRNWIAAVGAASDDPTTWNPNANASVWAIVVSDGTVYAGGDFDTIGGQTRNYIAALNVSDGSATSWNPGANGPTVTLAVSGDTVYAGGYFTNLGGLTRKYIGAVSTTNGLATSWNPIADGEICALAVSGERIYVGGGFSSIGGNPRNGFAVLMDCGAEALRLLERSRDYATDDLNAAGYDYSEAASSFSAPFPSAPAEPSDRDTPEEALLVATELFLEALAAYPGNSDFEAGLLESLQLYVDGCALVGNEEMQAGLRLKGRGESDGKTWTWTNRDLPYEINQADKAGEAFLKGIQLFHRVLDTPCGLAAADGAAEDTQAALRDRYALLAGRWIRASYERYLREFEYRYGTVGTPATSWASTYEPQIVEGLQEVLVQGQLFGEVLGVLCADAPVDDWRAELAQLDAELEKALGLMGQVTSGLNPLGYPEGPVPWAFRVSNPFQDNFEKAYELLLGKLSFAQSAEESAATYGEHFEDSRANLVGMLYNQWQSNQFLLGEALQICGANTAAPEAEWGVLWDGPWTEASACRVGALLQSLKTQRDKLDAVDVRMRNHFQRVADLKELARIEAGAMEAQVELVLEGGEAVSASALGLPTNAQIETTEYDIGWIRTGHHGAYELPFGVGPVFVPVAYHRSDEILGEFMQAIQTPGSSPSVLVRDFKGYLDDISKLFGSKEQRQQGQAALVQALQGATSVMIQGIVLAAQRQQQIKDEYLRVAETAAEFSVELDVLQNIATELNIQMERKEFLRAQLREAFRRHQQMTGPLAEDVAYYRLMRDDMEERAWGWFRESQCMSWILLRAMEQELCTTYDNRDSVFRLRTVEQLEVFAAELEDMTELPRDLIGPTSITYSLKEDLLHFVEGYPHPETGAPIEDPDSEFQAYVAANVVANDTDPDGDVDGDYPMGALRVIFPLSLRTSGEGFYTEVPSALDDRWDVRITSVVVSMDGSGLGTTTSPKTVWLWPRGPSQAVGEDEEVVAYELDDFRYPIHRAEDNSIKWETYQANKKAVIDLPWDGSTYYTNAGTPDLLLYGHHVANPQWELVVPLHVAGNRGILNNLAGLGDITVTINYTYRDLAPTKQGSGQ
ncbi:MAG: hypothetical protein KBC05_04150 [Candidatus Hydrogenedentes bacterium]|nr:hypothetical protein [Candidatus Hydrogenedentota bacterium]